MDQSATGTGEVWDGLAQPSSIAPRIRVSEMADPLEEQALRELEAELAQDGFATVVAAGKVAKEGDDHA